jgi:hypothetical protein
MVAMNELESQQEVMKYKKKEGEWKAAACRRLKAKASIKEGEGKSV